MRTFVRIAVALVVALAALEIASFAILHALALRDRGRLTGDEAAPAYRNVPWAGTYWREHRLFLARSFENYPYGLWRLRPFAGETINVGADGLRKTANVKCDGSAPLVYVFGSSAVWGQGSPDWLSIPSLLAKHYADDGHPACVVNHGSDAWRSSESVVQLIEELRRPGARLPAAVVFIDSCNDVFTPFYYTGKVDEPYNFKKGWLDALALIHQGSFYWLSATNSWTLAERLIRRARGSTLPAIKDADLLSHEIVDTYLANVRIVDGLSRAFGFRYEFFWLPLNVEGQDPIYRFAVEKTAPLIREHVGEHLHYLDIDPALTLGACHLVPDGNAVVADRIYQAIR